MSQSAKLGTNFQLKDKIALVTGGNGGLGLGAAQALKAAGATVVTWGRDSKKNKQVIKDGFLNESVDVSSEKSVVDAFQKLKDRFGRLDILINNAGVYEDQSILTVKFKDWQKMLDINLSSMLLCSQKAALLMVEQKSGKIVNIGSMYSLFGHPNSVGYASTKTAVLGFTRSLAAELGQYNIQVNGILPGWFETAINGHIPDTERGEEIRSRTPLGRWGQAQDIGGLVVFLASEASDFITGASIPIDGGYSISDRRRS